MITEEYKMKGIKGKCILEPSIKKSFQAEGFKIRPISHRNSVYIGWTRKCDMDEVKATLRKFPTCLIGLPVQQAEEVLSKHAHLQGVYMHKGMIHDEGETDVVWIAQNLKLKKRVLCTDDGVTITEKMSPHNVNTVSITDTMNDDVVKARNDVKTTIKVAA